MRLPAGFTSRPATSADALGITTLVNLCEQAYVREPVRVGEVEVNRWLGRALAAIVVCDETGTIVGCTRIVFRGEAILSDGAVLPARTGRGIGSFLLDWAAREAGTKRCPILRASVLAGDAAARALVLDRGFRYVRSFYRMLIDLTAAPPRPDWPPGVEVATLGEGEEEILHEVIEDSFARHWGHVRQSFDQWRGSTLLEPEVTFLARNGSDVVGAIVCNEDYLGDAFVAILGVREAWRGRGLGRALLLQGFAALYGKSKRRIGLGVDAGNETGAVRLYESVGMRIGGQEDVYETRL